MLNVRQYNIDIEMLAGHEARSIRKVVCLAPAHGNLVPDPYANIGVVPYLLLL